MGEAINLATKAPLEAEGRINFRVGVVIARGAGALARGYSWENGVGTHAEENAFAKLNGHDTRGAALYSSMAPCTGRSSGKLACLDLIYEKGIKTVAFACIASDEDADKLYKKAGELGIELRHVKGLEEMARAVNPHLNWDGKLI